MSYIAPPGASPVYKPWLIYTILIAFLANTFVPCLAAYGADGALGDFSGLRLPAVGAMVPLSPEFNPPILKGIKIHPDNPFRFDFILDKGDSLPLVGRAREGDLKQESTKLIKYFLASLTIPEKDLWVNLSPYEKDRIIPQSFGLTEMGRDLLAEDYMLKQITASLIYPEDTIGKKFWKRIYEEAARRFKTTNIPVNTFNKVWILPEKAVVYENAKAGTAYVVEAKLKVMLEQDYLALSKHVSTKIATSPSAPRNDTSTLASQIVREIIIPQLTKEVNTAKNFSQLRQVYNSLILATWYKKKIKDSILAQVYADRNKIAGIGYGPNDVELIYQRYLQAFKKGVYNYIKEEQDPLTQEITPKKYFSGGEMFLGLGNLTQIVHTFDPAQITQDRLRIVLSQFDLANAAMAAKKPPSTSRLIYRPRPNSGQRGAPMIAGLPIDEARRITDIRVQQESYTSSEQHGLSSDDPNVMFSLLSEHPKVLGIVVAHIKREVPARSKVLSIGEGRGHLAEKLKDLGFDVTAIDISPENVKITQDRGVHAIVGDANHLPATIRDHSFDCVVFSESIGGMLLDGPLKEALRVLKPGGKIILTFYPEEEFTVDRRRLSQTTKFLYYSFEEVRSALQKSGFISSQDKAIPKGVTPKEGLFKFNILHIITAVKPADQEGPPKTVDRAQLSLWKEQGIPYLLFNTINDEAPQVRAEGRNQILRIASKHQGSSALKGLEALATQWDEGYPEIVQAPEPITDRDLELRQVKAREALVTQLRSTYPLLAEAIEGNNWESVDVKGVGVLVELLSNQDKGVIKAVANIIGNIADKRPELVRGIADELVRRLRGGQWGIDGTAVAIRSIADGNLALLLDVKGLMGALIERLGAIDSDERQAVEHLVVLLIAKEPISSVKDVLDRLVALLGDESREVREAVVRVIGEIASKNPELIKGIMETLKMNLNNQKSWEIRQGAAWTIGAIAQKNPTLLDQGIMEALKGRLEDNELWEVRLAATLALTKIADHKPELMDVSGVRDALAARLGDKDSWEMRRAAALAIGNLSWQQSYSEGLIEDMVNFVQDPKDGLGMSGQEIYAGMNLVYAFLRSGDPDGLDLFVKTIKIFNQQEKETLVSAGCDYFKANAFKDFIKILRSRSSFYYDSLVQDLQDEFLKILGIDDAIEGKTLNTWEGIDPLLIQAGRYSITRKVIIDKIIVTLRLLREGAGTGFRKESHILETFGDFKDKLIHLLQMQDIPLYVKRRLLQSFPFVDQDAWVLLRARAVLLVRAATGLQDSRVELVGTIRQLIHNNVSPQDLAVVEVYKTFVENQDAKGKDQQELFTNAWQQLERMGFIVKESDRVPASRKERTLAACDDLLSSLKDVYNGGSLENVSKLIEDLSKGLSPEQRRILKPRVMADQVDSLRVLKGTNLENLKETVNIRHRLNEMIKNARGDALYRALELDLRLTILVLKVFTSMDETLRYSPESLLLMLKNTRINGYGGGVILNHLIDELESIVKEKDSPRKDMRVYSIIKRTERILKKASGQVFEDYQTMAEKTGKALGVAPEDQIWVNNFSLNLFRGGNIYLLSLLVKSLKQQIKKTLGLKDWEIISEGTMSGKLRYVKNLNSLSSLISDGRKDEILVVKYLPADFLALDRFAGVIVFEEDSLLSHPAIIARQNGIPYVVCSDKRLLESYYDEEVTITAQGDNVEIKSGLTGEQKPAALTNLGVRSIPTANLNSDDIIFPQHYDATTTGLKGLNLSEMDKIPLAARQKQAKHLTLSFAYYEHVLQDPDNQESRDSINQIISGLEGRYILEKTEVLANIRHQIGSLKIPREMLERTRRAIRQQIPQGLVFLRSSTNAEDLIWYAGAGLYDSFAAIDPDNLEQLEIHIKKVWASVWNYRAYRDRRRNGIDHRSVYMAVLVQEMVNPAYSFVIHTRNPQKRNANEMMIEVMQGFGEGLVSGNPEYQGASHRFVYDSTDSITRIKYANKDWQLVLVDGQLGRKPRDYKNDIFTKQDTPGILRNLFKQAQRVAQLSDSKKGLDIEGCIIKGKDGLQFVFVQSREEQGVKDNAMIAEIPGHLSQESDVGGINLTDANLNLQTQNAGTAIKFHLDPAMLQKLQSSPGLVPVILNIQPMTDLRAFLGLNVSQGMSSA